MNMMASEDENLKSKLSKAERTFNELNSTLHMHHAIEEARMFPMLARKGAQVDRLNEQHDEMRRRETNAIKAFKQSNLNEVRESVYSFGELLLDHLNQEEEISIPYLLQMKLHEI
eukprot:TRINITY_DN6267_c0_g1_i1.p1 TRINITY_DN6267_c0_g1~~TRINITY_DN6267_c0_g1_i1.p1  ORF type:complete len:115 (-),score=30.95 TRINITY_DN6267_c0_g1_i1:17-361(-)